ncbi:tRNA(His) guanylyltransferase Thg1 family protein [Methanothermobacter wolfeii]|uniref:Guanylyltransferase n=2 Tax=Methanothermobacter TaxID=145260 RepID=A0A9E7RTX3_METWO|nr:MULTISPECIES: tRNA(His) guanylyltransferase Thg1 family protein [Methanothermobacter]MDI6701952.1 tRNA(His) guanylyltransferase Thg1 family protein [Methanothermobacter wolfeii]MDI6842574.1 tRNA(His) guanylyltransferase Thg1 family protein [Methanothermobacter wolfeii]REE28385.1 tRNA(His)-5'-guanylyltransferase [Methanothermobacter defluvii]UXH31258.1 guanylyltransferase [Methanothermobacter wolfeii]SCM57965.1 putative protein {ECO:0000313/EMBL:ADL58945,1} [Methanothermobacter wolfeii]
MVFDVRSHETYSSLRVPPSAEVVLRLDGRGFHGLTEKLGFTRPYDENFRDIMAATSMDIMEEFSPAFIYTFSDEINILLSEVPFSGRVEKLDSVFAALASSSFTLEALSLGFKLDQAVSFDCRTIPLAGGAVQEYFRSRQSEAWRNCLNGYAYWTLRAEMGKEEAVRTLEGLKSEGIHDLLFERGINISRVPSWQRRGIGVYRRPVEVEGYNPLRDERVTASRMRTIVDMDLPLFTGEFFRELIRTG